MSLYDELEQRDERSWGPFSSRRWYAKEETRPDSAPPDWEQDPPVGYELGFDLGEYDWTGADGGKHKTSLPGAKLSAGEWLDENGDVHAGARVDARTLKHATELGDGSTVEVAGPSGGAAIDFGEHSMELGLGAELAHVTYESAAPDAAKTDRQTRVGLSEGVGMALRLQDGDTDGDGDPEYGIGADLGPFILDYRTEDPGSDAAILGAGMMIGGPLGLTIAAGGLMTASALGLGSKERKNIDPSVEASIAQSRTKAGYSARRESYRDSIIDTNRKAGVSSEHLLDRKSDAAYVNSMRMLSGQQPIDNGPNSTKAQIQRSLATQQNRNTVHTTQANIHKSLGAAEYRMRVAEAMATVERIKGANQAFGHYAK